MWCNAARQYTRSKESATKGNASALPSWRTTLRTFAAVRRAGAELEESHGQVDAHHQSYVGRDDLGRVAGATRDIERDQVGVERLEPLDDAAAGAAHER